MPTQSRKTRWRSNFLVLTAVLAALTAGHLPARAGVLDELSPDNDLVKAIEKKDREAFRLAIVKEIRPTARDSLGVPAIVLAVETKDVFFVKALLKAGARPDDKPRQRDDDRTALTRAAELGDADMVRALLHAGADPDLPGTQSEPAIVKAAGLGHTDVMQALIEASADLEATDMTGRTPLEIARRGGHGRIVSMLEAAGAKY